jgi:peptidoglycan/xylan/chitin deacetylase (PgdA/CDA1 family)
VTFDVDSEAAPLWGLGRSAHRRSALLSWASYDRIAVPRILDGWRRLGIKQSFYIPAWVMKHHPDLVTQIADAGHEVGLHGYVHEIPLQLDSYEQERFCLERAVEIAERTLGYVPSGWRVPGYGFSDHTAQLLVEFGFRYDSSLYSNDVPYIIETSAGPLWELPIELSSEDGPHFGIRPNPDAGGGVMQAPRDCVDVWRADLEGMYEIGGLFIIAAHPLISGRPGRWLEFMQFFEELVARDDVWVTTLGAIVDHTEKLRAAGEFEPMRERLPYFDGPVEEVLEVLGLGASGASPD